MKDFLEILQTVSRLNSWVRAPERHAPYRAIYWLKGEALKRACLEGLCIHRKVMVKAKCRDCGGTGKYVGSCGETYDHCYACQNTGIVNLRFVETTIAEKITWHTPWERAWNFDHGLEYDKGPWEMPGDSWTVHQPGQNLTVLEAAAALNEAEHYFNARPGVCTWYSDSYGGGDNFDYRFYLGSKVRQCSLCGESDEEKINSWYGAGKGKLCWTDCACKACDKRAGEHTAAIFLFFEPPEISREIEVRVWEARHLGMFPLKDGR